MPSSLFTLATRKVFNSVKLGLRHLRARTRPRTFLPIPLSGRREWNTLASALMAQRGDLEGVTIELRHAE